MHDSSRWASRFPFPHRQINVSANVRICSFDAKRTTHRADNRSEVMSQMDYRVRVGHISIPYGLGFATDWAIYHRYVGPPKCGHGSIFLNPTNFSLNSTQTNASTFEHSWPNPIHLPKEHLSRSAANVLSETDNISRNEYYTRKQETHPVKIKYCDS